MTLEDAIAAVEACEHQASLNAALQSIAEDAGFDSYCFVDTGAPHLDEPFHTGTTGRRWEDEYRDNGFIHVDACIARARRTNRPFPWGSVSLPQRTGKRKPGALKAMEAATDHGFQEGFVIPFHFCDDRGTVYSSVCTFFWRDSQAQFKRALEENAYRLHLVLLYWAQRSLEIRSAATVPAADNVTLFNRAATRAVGGTLSDRERDVIAWAARGKTMAETAEILNISTETVQSHLKNCVRKLDAANKTHAVAKAIHLNIVSI